MMRIKQTVACLLTAVLGVTGVMPGFAASPSSLLARTPLAPQAASTQVAAETPGETAPDGELQAEAAWVDESAYRGIGWDMSLEEVAAAEQGKARSTTVTVQEDLWLYGLEMKKLVYQFKDGAMVSRTFTAKLNNADAFSYLFFSLFRRYGIPILAQKRKAVWADPVATITLQRDSEGLTIRYEAL